MVDPTNYLIQIFTHENGIYQLHRPYTHDELIQSQVINGLSIDLKVLFPDHLREPEVEYGENVSRIYQ